MDSRSILELLYEDDVEFAENIPMKPVGNTVSITNVMACGATLLLLCSMIRTAISLSKVLYTRLAM